MAETGIEVVADTQLSENELQDVLDRIDEKMIPILRDHPTALNIFQMEHSPEEQLTDSIEYDQQEKRWVCVVSFTRGELAVKSFPKEDPLLQRGFFIYQDRNMLEYREMREGRQISYSNSKLAAEHSLGVVSNLEKALITSV